MYEFSTQSVRQDGLVYQSLWVVSYFTHRPVEAIMVLAVAGFRYFFISGGIPYTSHGAQITNPSRFCIFVFSCFYAYFRLC